MRGFIYTPRASLEIEQISDYTNSQWGQSQALKYIDDMEALFVQLTIFPDMGEITGVPHEQTQKIAFNSHIIYYDVSDDNVVILAVLHKNQLPDL